MIKYQKNKYSMFVGVRAYLDDHSTGYEDNEEFNEHISSYKSVLQEIARKEDERSKATTGQVKNKAKVRRSVSDQALAVAGAIYSFAKKTGNVTLKESVDFTKTDLDRFRDAVLVIELNSIKDKAIQYSTEISRYGITADKFSEFENKIAKYVEALGSKNTGSATKQGANKTMVSLFKEADSLVDSIDRFMENYNVSDKDFYDGYKAARSIKDLGIRHNGGNGSIGINGNTGGPDNTGQNNPQTAGLITSGNSNGNNS